MTTPKGKRCSMCGSLQPLYRFHANSGTKDGLHSYCVDCARERVVGTNRAAKTQREYQRRTHRHGTGYGEPE